MPGFLGLQMQKSERVRRVKGLLRLVALLAALLLLCSCGQAPAESTDHTKESEMTVELFALNVGKADAILVTVGEKRFLVDTGTKDGYNRLEEMLKELGVTRLDGVFLTHTDKDHGGGMKQLSKSDISVDTWYAASIFCEKKPDKHQAVLAARERGTEVHWLNAGDVIELGEACRFEVLGPLTPDEQCENNNSLVLRLVTPEGIALLTGDMEKEGEARLMASGVDLSADYLKVAHHGRDDATSAAFVAAVSPQVAVISTSTAERPDSPAEEVLDILEGSGAWTYVTQDQEMGIRVALRAGEAVLLGAKEE